MNDTADLLNPNLEPYEDSVDASSIEALTSARARRAEKNASVLKSAADAVSSENASTTLIAEEDEIPLQTGSPADLEEEAASEGAFNPETGEINWDCPCLGGMAHGPCGPEFREAFSCFVFSEEEPKGMDCIDKFQNMQECFKLHPEVYKGELEDDEELDAGLEAEKQELVNEIAERRAQQQESVQQRLLEEPAPAASKPPRKSKKSTSEVEQKSFKQGESKPPKPQGKEKAPDREDVFADQDSADEKHSTKPEEDTAIPKAGVVPKAAHDARGSVGVKTTEK